MEGDIITLQDIYKYDYKAMSLVADGHPPGVRRPTRRPRRQPARWAVRRTRTCGSDEAADCSSSSRSCCPGWPLSLFSPSAPADAQVPPENVEVMLAVDTSGSMRPAIDAAKAAANEFVASMPADVRIGVETFGDAVTVLTPPTTDRALLIEQINGIVASGNTALYDAVVTASQQFTPGIENRVLVVLSDGKDEGSTATLDDASPRSRVCTSRPSA